MSKTKENTKTKSDVKGSEIFGHAIAGVGQNVIYVLWSSYMMIFFTDVFGITAGVATAIITATRVWDAINDPMMGYVADRTKTRWGRYRPWLLFMSIPVVICLVLNFSTPNISSTGKIIWAAVTYVAMSMAFTAVDIPYWTLPTVMSQDTGKRTSIISISKASTSIASIALGVIAVPLIMALGKGNMATGYQRTALIVGLIGAVCYLVGFALIREHVAAPSQEKLGFKNGLQVITKNKPLLIILLCLLFTNVTTTLRQNMLLYYTQYNLGNLELSSIFSLLMLPGMMLGVIITPLLAKKVGQKQLYIGVSIFGAAVNTIFFFAGYKNLLVVAVLYAISSIPVGVTSVLCGAMIMNTIEYAEWKTGQRREGLISSTQTFITKASTALGVLINGIVLMIANFTPNVAQDVHTLQLFHGSFTILGAFLGIIGMIPMLFYTLTDKRHAEIVAELQKRNSGEKDSI